MTPPSGIRARFVRAVEPFGNRVAPGDPDLGGFGFDGAQTRAHTSATVHTSLHALSKQNWG